MSRCVLGLVCVAALVSQAEESAPAPARGIAALHVPDGFIVEVAAGPELSSYPMFMTFDLEGRLFIAESSGVDRKSKLQVESPDMMILMLEDTNADGTFDKRTVFADKLALPMGVLCYRGSVYVAAPPDLLRLKDTDGDGVADEREVLLTGWNVLNTASLHGPFLGPDGWLYLTHGRHGYKIKTKEGQVLEGMAARIWRCRPDGTGLERFAGGGFDNPVELVFTPEGNMLGTMTYFQDPRNGQRDALMHWVEGGVYPKPGDVTSEMIRTGDLMPTMTKFARIAPAGLLQYRSKVFGDEFQSNLFSAQFNPHRVQRHKLFRDGATWRTEDSDFLTSTDPDFHPTDVLEDADGSLLVSDTGAWYVDACPISRVAKPEIRGGIYRIRKKDAPKVEDPWGKAMGFGADLTWEQIAQTSFTDERPYVRDIARYICSPMSKDQNVIGYRKMLASKNEALRAQAVWLAGQVETEEAKELVRQALPDPAAEVKIAAAHMAGLNRDAKAAPDLIRNLQSENPVVRRETASALARLGDASASQALISAVRKAVDRFEEHAIIYALIQIGNVEPLRVALTAKNAPTRKAALIALDQMAGGLLTREQFAPSLLEEGEELRKTALWVASRHADWADLVLETVRARLRAPGITEEARAGMKDVVAAFARDAGMQGLLAELALDRTLQEGQRLFVLELMDGVTLDPYPESWVQAMSSVLEQGRDGEKRQVIGMIGKRGLSAFDQRLLTVAEEAQAPAGVRIAAFTALSGRTGAPAPALLEFLLGQLQEGKEPLVRVAAAKAIAKARLDAPQLQRVARECLGAADSLVFPALLEAFRGLQEEPVGLELVAALKKANINPVLIPGGLDALLSSFPPSVQAAAADLRAQLDAEKEKRIARLKTIEPEIGHGDVGRGRRVFFGDIANCHACHAVGSEGGRLGPDLTTIGTVRSAHDLLEAVLFPSASFVPDYEPYRVETQDEVYLGNILRQDAASITLATGVNQEVIVPRADVISMEPHTVSIMPEGLDTALSREELLDLLAFLQSLNQEQWLLPERRESK